MKLRCWMGYGLLLGSSLVMWSGCPDPGDDDQPSVTPPVESTPEVTPTLEPTTPTATPVQDDVDGDGYTVEEGDCDDGKEDVHPDAEELPYDGIDQDCQNGDLVDVDGDGYTAVQAGGDDCDDENGLVYPEAAEVADLLDNDCDGQVDEDLDTVDNDGDGFAESQGDCDDADPRLNPDAVEIPYDDIDQDCSGGDLQDVDGDGVKGGEYGPDCNDEDASISPSMTDVPYDGIDQNCDGSDLTDVDGDGVPGGSNGADCDDQDPAKSPSNLEIPYDGIDNNCDGTDLTDVDGDGQDALEASGTDCQDQDATIYVGATEVPYDGIDQDCSGADLNDIDVDGFPGGTEGTDCDDLDLHTYPGAPEFADEKDNDCDGKVDEELDSTDDDGDTLSELDGDCDDRDSSIYPGATEIPYDGLDQDCSGVDLTDVDGDGVDSSQVADGFDCDDGNDSIYPGAVEVPYDGIDQDCSGIDLVDVDGDGVASTVAGGQDCNDADPFIGPQVGEVPYDGIDQDCSEGDLIDVDGDGYSAAGVGGPDCNDVDSSINPDALEICDGMDNDCDNLVDILPDGGAPTDASTWYLDGDHDGYGDVEKPVAACEGSLELLADSTDCNDADAADFPGAEERCDGLDNSCDGQIDEGVQTTFFLDADEDGFGTAGSTLDACTLPAGYAIDDTDCDDGRDSVYPDAPESCDLLDNDCDGQVDEGVKSTFYQDVDEDGYGNSAVTTQACSAPQGYVADKTDCNDRNQAINPGELEICNGKDDDCDTQVDEGAKITFYQDLDKDGYGNAAISLQACTAPAGYVVAGTDCNDGNVAISPGAVESCNGVDDDCDKNIDEGVKSTFYLDADLDGYGTSATTIQACIAPAGYVSTGNDCKDSNAAIHPDAAEACNGIDDNCDTVADEGVKVTFYLDVDKDGYGSSSVTTLACAAPAGYVSIGGDCNDSTSAVNPAMNEVCDPSNLDEDCDGTADDGDSSTASSSKTSYYPDNDSDGYGATGTSAVLYCDDPSTSSQLFAATNTDCNDANAAINPSKEETLNEVDDNCNGQVDEGTWFTSCRAMKLYYPSTVSGYYTIDVDGPSGATLPFKVYCDMTSAGGGWTRIYYQDSADGSFFKVGEYQINRDKPESKLYAILNDLERFRRDGGFEFKMDWPSSQWTDYMHWSQTNNPVMDVQGALPTGYKGIHIPYTYNGWGGLQKSFYPQYSLLDGTLDPLGNWYYAVGTTYTWNSLPTPQPGPTGGVAIAELWVR